MYYKSLLICFSLFPLWSAAQVNVNDSLVLVAIYNETNGPNWTKQENWLSALPIQEWEGINVTNGRVTSVEFTFAGLDGTLPEAIFSLDSLKEFSIRESNAILNYDSRVQMWTALEIISVSGGNMTGDINAFCGLPKLREISFYNCPLGGAIPTCFQNMALTRLNFSGAQLDEAPLPEFLGKILSLTSLTISKNQFTGTIPTAYCNSNFKFLNLGDNQLIGQIPTCLNADNNLIQIFVEENNLDGEIPIEMLGSNLTILELSKNNFSGNIDGWPVMASLDRLGLSDNSFTGTFDGSFMSSSNYRILELENNRFDKIQNFADFPLLSTLRIQNNNFNFSDFEELKPNNSNFTYSPQAPLGDGTTLNLQDGEMLNLSMDAGGTVTTYQWFKNDQQINGATQADFTIASVQMGDAGTYHCEALHDSFPNLTLMLAPIVVNVGTSNLTAIEQADWRIVGNPVQSQIVLERIGKATGTTPIHISVFDINGTLVKSQSANPNQLNQLIFNAQNIHAGLYTLQILQNGTTASFRILKL